LKWVAWYYGERLHSALGYVTPDEYEHTYWDNRRKPHRPLDHTIADSTKLGAAQNQA
jgi:hypothetical protein